MDHEDMDIMDIGLSRGFAGDDLASYGMRHLVYIKPFRVDAKLYHALHAADGTQLIIVEARELAEATIRLHALEPVSVH